MHNTYNGDTVQTTWGLDLKAGFGCQMTTIFRIYGKMELGFPAFAIVTYFLHWAFIASFAYFLFTNQE